MIAKIVVVLAVVGVLAAQQQKPPVGTFDLVNGQPSPVRNPSVAVPIPQPVPARKTRDTAAAAPQLTKDIPKDSVAPPTKDIPKPHAALTKDIPKH